MSEQKNILLICVNKFNEIGGIETYNKKLIQIIEKYFRNVNIDIFLPCVSSDKKNLDEKYNGLYQYYVNNIKTKNTYINFILSSIYSKYRLKKLLNKKKYDLIINSTNYYFKKIANWNNYFFVQHFNFEYYQSKFEKGFISFTKRIIKNLIGANCPINKNKNLILFDENNKELYFKLFNKNSSNISCIPLCTEQEQILDIEYKTLHRKNIIFFGRLVIQKNIKNLIEINNDIDKIDFFGSISQTKYGKEVFEILKKRNWYKGILNSNSLYETINKYKFSINYSLYEGFPFSVVESLACGVPAIIKDSFTSASFLTSYDKRLLIPKDATIKEATHQINSLLNLKDEEYCELCKKALNFFKQNLSYEIFEKKWLEIFNKFLE